MKKIFLIRWFSDDNVWRAYNSEVDAKEFACFVNNHVCDDSLKVYVDSCFIE